MLHSGAHTWPRTRFIAFTLALLSGCVAPPRRSVGTGKLLHRTLGTPGPAQAAAPPEPATEAATAEAIPHAPGQYFRTNAFHEDALAGQHEHALVQLLGIPLFVIRDEDVFKSPADRATAIARVLQETLHAGDRFFILGSDGGLPAIYSVSHHGGYPRLVLRVTPADAVAYARRSGRDVDQHLLAAWWLAVLKDVFGVVFFNEPPKFTATADAAESLIVLREKLWGGGQTEPVSPERLAAAQAAVSAGTRHNLRALAFAMPREFTSLGQGDPTAPDAR